MRKLKRILVCLAVAMAISVSFAIKIRAADWDIVASPTSEVITTPAPAVTSENTGIGLPAVTGTGIVMETDVSLPIPEATLPLVLEGIIGTDDRSVVSDTTAFPYRTSCLLVIHFPDGITYGSGNLVSNDTILTAGHCVYDAESGGWATAIEVYAGRNGLYAPYGKAEAKAFYTLDKWISSASYEYDIGHIKLKQKLGKTTGWLGFTTTLGNDISLTGFPTPQNRGYRMYSQKGKLKRATTNNIYYDLDTEGGQSSSAVYTPKNQIIGVHSGWDRINSVNLGTHMNAQNFETTKKIADTAILSYRSHVQEKGWLSWVNDLGTAGTTGQSRRMEALNLKLTESNYSGNIEYRSHVQEIGWQGWQKNGAQTGTTGQSKRLEAIEIKLTGELAKIYNVRYRSHVQGIGWQAWKSNGQTSGTTGQSLRLEAIQIQLVKK